MNAKNSIYLFLLFLIAASCSSGKKAYERGDYYSAVIKSASQAKPRPWKIAGNVKKLLPYGS
jgi:hypothetical protein